MQTFTQTDITEEYEANDYFLLMDEISMESCREVIQWIVNANLSDEPPDILNLIICSPGGHLESAFACIDMMRGSTIPIRTIGIGFVCSAGLTMFLAGTKGRRIITPLTSILSHQYSGGTEGKSFELIASIKEFLSIEARMINHYKECTNLSEEVIRDKLLPPHDIWLTASEAKELGLCDKVENISISSFTSRVE